MMNTHIHVYAYFCIYTHIYDIFEWGEGAKHYYL